jgi:hypothetical protein
MSTSELPEPGASPSWRLSDSELRDQIMALESSWRQADGALLDALCEAEKRGLATNLGYRSSADMQNTLMSVSRQEAKRRMARVRALNSGAFPFAAQAVRNGSISSQHLDQIAKFQASLSDVVHPGEWAKAEEILVGFATAWDPAGVRRFALRQLGPHLDPDGHLPSESELAEPENRLRLDWRRNGWLHFDGDLEPEAAALFAARFDARSKPRPATEEGPDPRTAEQRQGDGMAEWVGSGREAAGSADGGERAQLTVTIGLDQLINGLGTAALGPDMLPISVSEARRLACDCGIVPIVLSADSMPLDIGRATRNISPHIRRAVTGRDKGCTFPGCDRPPKDCQAHHLVEWQHGGETALPNLALLCGWHHRIIHHTDWEIRMNRGRPEFLPPAHLDPQRRPRTNEVHRGCPGWPSRN